MFKLQRMKKIFIITFIFCSQVFSQIKSGEVIYGITFGEDKELQTGMLAEYYNDAKSKGDLVSFKLEFNREKMVFFPNDNLSSNDSNLRFVHAFSGVQGKYFTNKNSNTILNEMNNHIGHLNIKKDLNIIWNLTKETKMIDKYLCFKATTILTIINSVGEFKRDLVAWYCPEIPFPFGPKGYGNLPGLILELQEKEITLGAKSILLSNKNREIDKPADVKIVTEKELNELINEFKPE